MANSRLHPMLLAVVVMCLSFLQCERTLISLMLQETAKLEDPSSREANLFREARVCVSKPDVIRRVPSRMRGCRALLCCPPNSNIAVTPPSNVLPTQTKPKHHNIGKNETRYTNLGHTKNRSVCQFSSVSAPTRFSLSHRQHPGQKYCK